MARKPLTIPKLIKKADHIFSLMVRLQAADKNGICQCVTCGRMGHYKTMDCGHFSCRSHGAVRFHLWNTGVQCTVCNRYRGGEAALFSKYILEKHGREAIDLIASLSSQSFKWNRTQLLLLIQTCTKTVNELRKEKGLY